MFRRNVILASLYLLLLSCTDSNQNQQKEESDKQPAEENMQQHVEQSSDDSLRGAIPVVPPRAGEPPGVDKETGETADLEEMLKDSASVNMVMNNIAARPALRQVMMQKILHEIESDSAQTRAIWEAIMQNRNFRTMAMNLSQEDARVPEKASESKGPEIIVKFKPGTEQNKIKEMESEIGLRQVKEISALRMKVYQVISEKSINEAIVACQKKAFVEYAEPNQRLQTQK